MRTINPYPCKRLPRWQVDLVNRIFEKDPGLSFKLGKDNYALLVHTGGDGFGLPETMAATIRVDEKIRFELYPEDTLLSMLLGEYLSVDEFQALGDTVRSISLEVAMESLLDRIDRFSGGHSTIERVGEEPTSGLASETIGFCLRRHGDGRQGRGVLRTNTDGMQWLVARWGRLPGKRRRLLDHLPIPLGIEVGRVDLPAARIHDLQCLDIILADGAGALNEREIRLWDGHDLTFTGKAIKPDQFKVEKIMNGKKDTMNRSIAPSNKRPATTLAAGDIPVTLVFEIGQTQITMGDLQQMQAGYTFTLAEPIDMDCPVTIKANGVVVGKGEMVMIDDRLGVQVHDFMDNNQKTLES